MAAMRRSLLILVLAAGALAIPQAAGAAVVSHSSGTNSGGSPFEHLVFDAVPGEANNLVVTEPSPGTFVFQDAVAVTSSYCQQGTPSNPASPNAVTCQAAQLTALSIHAGNGANRVSVYGDTPVSITGVGASENHFNGGDGHDTIAGGDGPDVLFGGPGNDSLSAGLGADDVRGGTGNDSLAAGAGNDTLIGGSGSDTEEGGAGEDTSDYGSRLGSVYVSLNDLPGDGQEGEQDNLGSDVENVIGGAGPDQLIAQSGAVGNDLFGGLGDDLLSGAGGNDTTLSGGPGQDDLYGGDGLDGLYGGAGDDELRAGSGADLVSGDDADDVLEGGTGPDTMLGGAGIDTVSYGAEVSPITADPDGVSGDDGATGEGDTVKADVENVVGGFAPDLLAGNDGANLIRGGAGADEIDGRGGTDQLFGDDGGDTLRSLDSAVDSVDCGSGADAFEADGGDALTDCETNLGPPVEPLPPATRSQPLDPGTALPGAAVLPGPVVRIGPARVRLTARGSARLLVSCPATAREQCLGTLRLTRRRAGRARSIGTQRFSIVAGRSQRVAVRVARRTVSGLPAAGLSVRAVAAARDAASSTRSTDRAVRILRPRTNQGGSR